MANIAHAAEYRYFSFTYFTGKAYFGLAERVGMYVGFSKLSVHGGPQPTGCGPFFTPFIVIFQGVTCYDRHSETKPQP